MSLPVLAPAFLTKHPPSPELFAKYLGQGPWGPNCIPVYEWQGILFIACADPELISENKPENWCYVKSDVDVISPFFAELSKKTLPSNPEAIVDLTKPHEASAYQVTAQNSELIDLQEIENTEEQKKNEEIETLDFTSEEDRRTSITTKSEVIPDLSALKFNHESDKLKNIELSAKRESTQEPPPIVIAENNNSQATQAHSPVQPPTFMQDDEWLKIWNGLSGHFQNSMICLIQQNEIIPWKWDPSLISPDAEPQILSLEIPSPFRIIARTGRPYHGTPIQNSVSDEFFKKWTHGKYPEHLTGVPLFKNQGLLGFLICWGNQSSASKDSLQVCEAFAKQASQLIKKQIEKSKTEPTAA